MISIDSLSKDGNSDKATILHLSVLNILGLFAWRLAHVPADFCLGLPVLVSLLIPVEATRKDDWLVIAMSRLIDWL